MRSVVIWRGRAIRLDAPASPFCGREAATPFARTGAVGRSVVAPPGVSPDRLQTLRKAFHATMNDPQFLAEARQLKLDFEPLSGDELGRIAERVITIGAAECERAQAMAK